MLKEKAGGVTLRYAQGKKPPLQWDLWSCDMVSGIGVEVEEKR